MPVAMLLGTLLLVLEIHFTYMHKSMRGCGTLSVLYAQRCERPVRYDIMTYAYMYPVHTCTCEASCNILKFAGAADTE